MDEVAAARDALEAKMGKQLGDADRPAARVGALGCAVLDAGHDGHRPQPRAQRRVGEGPREADRATSASRTTRTAASCRCSARSCSTSPATSSKRRCTTSSRRRASASTPSSAPTTSPGSSRRSRASCASEAGVDFPDDPHRAAAATRSKPCSSRGTASGRSDYRKIERHPRRPRHRGQRADDGVRQQGRRLRHRRRVHAQPVDR